MALALSLSAPAVAQPDPTKRTISLPAGPLTDALIRLATQTGASIGYADPLPKTKVRAVRNAKSVNEALRILLAGTGLLAVQTGPLAWRIVAQPKQVEVSKPSRRLPTQAKPPRVSPRSPPPLADAVPPNDIIVTATKVGDSIQKTPLSVILLSGADLASFGATPNTPALAALADGLVLTNLGPGRNRIFIRGVADSPFNGVTQATVAVELEDARVTFNAPDPDLRLVDIEAIELLEGPQGPLHGTGALGGVYRIVPKPPKLNEVQAEIAVGTEALSGGGIGANGSAMINLPIVADRLGLRAVVYGATEPGWIDRDGPSGKNSNKSQVSGGRADLRWIPADGWSVDLAGVIQLLHVDDSQYATSPTKIYRRAGAIAEPHDNDFVNGRLTVRGRVAGADLVSISSWTSHEVDSSLDATAAGTVFGQNGPLLFEDDRIYRLINQEIRLSGGNRTHWLAGLSYLDASTNISAELRPATSAALAIGNLDQTNTEIAAFANLTVPIGKRWRFDPGLRLFRAISEDERQEAAGAAVRQTKRTGVSPSASLSWAPSDRHFLYLRYARAFRPAGLSPFVALADAEFDSDELESFELGGRLHSANGRWNASGTAYFATWDHIQSDYLLPSGLIATRNSGTGQIYGAEARLAWHNRSWQVSGGLDVQHARLETPEPGLALSPDQPLPIVTSYKAHLVAHRLFDLSPGTLSIGGRVNRVGASRLSLDPALDRRISARSAVDLDGNFQWGRWRLDAGIDNLLGSHADTFAFGNPFSIGTMAQRTPVHPRTFRFGFRKSWP